MSSLMKVKSFWTDIHDKNWDVLARYFAPKAAIEWPNTNECFTTEEFIMANREYPGDWEISIVRIEHMDSTIVTVTHVQERESNISYYATSFFEFENSLIVRLTEYWSENGDAPEWRKHLIKRTGHE